MTTMQNNPYLTHASIDRIPVDDYMEAALIRLFSKLGLDSGIKVSRTGNSITITKKFHYVGSAAPTDTDDGRRVGNRVYSLEQFALLIFRLGRARAAKINKIHGLVAKSEEILSKLKEVLQ